MVKRVCVSVLLIMAAALAAAAQQAPAAAFDDQLQKASILLRARKYDEAIKEYKRAAKMKADDPAPWFGLAQAYQKLGAYKDSLDAARRVFPLASDKIMLSNAHSLAGVALIRQGDNKKDRKKYQEAGEEFRASVAANPQSGTARFNLGTALLKQGRDAEGQAELQRCLECDPNPATAKTAQQYLDNPRRARENFAPDFSFTTLQGEYVSLEELQGKVVLLDFWATWCPPCRDSVGDLKFFVKKFSKDPVVVLSISADHDEDALRKFVADKKMEWPQYWDHNGQISRLFGVHAFPSYIVLDGEGIIAKGFVGAGGFRAAEIEDAIKKALKALPPKPKEQNAAGAG